MIEAECDDLLRKGVLRESFSEWASRIVLVKKKDGSPRVCVDYRGLNELIDGDAYPNPDVQMCLRALAGAKVFS